MRNRLLLIINGSVILFTMILLFGYFASSPGAAQTTFVRPDPATGVFTATHLAYVTYEEAGTAAIMAAPVLQSPNQSSQVNTTQAPQTFSSQPEPPACQTDAAYASPDGRTLILQYNCEANLFIRVQDFANPDARPVVHSRGYFLNWSPDSAGFLFRNVDEDQILYIPIDNTAPQPFNLPFGTYDAAFAPDGRTLVYAASKGLGFGSEIGVVDLDSGATLAQHKFPRQIAAYPRWSPDSTQMVYILMPDSNTPFTTGELWLTDAFGAPTALLDSLADAGHGYPPAWAPDGQSIAWIRRENPDSVIANHSDGALHSNIYQVNTEAVTAIVPQAAAASSGYQATPVPTTQVPAVPAVQLTHFDAGLLYDITWSPDGSQLAFTANDAVWTLAPGAEAIQVSQPDTTARHPAWLATP
jgi:Tol biopolymer transport system component